MKLELPIAGQDSKRAVMYAFNAKTIEIARGEKKVCAYPNAHALEKQNPKRLCKLNFAHEFHPSKVLVPPLRIFCHA